MTLAFLVLGGSKGRERTGEEGCLSRSVRIGKGEAHRGWILLEVGREMT